MSQTVVSSTSLSAVSKCQVVFSTEYVLLLQHLRATTKANTYSCPGCVGDRCRLVRVHSSHDAHEFTPDQFSGIGLESSLLFAQEGANVLLVDVNLVAAEKTLKLVNERFPNVKASALKADVSKEADVKAAVDKAIELFSRLDVMVCISSFLSPTIVR